MDRHLSSGFTDAVASGRLSDAGALDAGLADEIGSSFGHLGQHGVDIASVGSVGAVIERKNGCVVIEMDSGTDSVATDMVDEFVMCNSMQPGGEGPAAVVSRTFGVQGK